LLGFLATGCQTNATIDQAEIARPTPTPAAPDAPTAVPPVETPSANPTAVPAPTRTVVPDGESTVFGGSAPAPFQAPGEWDEALPLDDQVLTGTLTNGMTYFVRPNDRPGSQAQLRLVVQVGSIDEEPGSEGVAHFLEHMMFNGTERFPGNEIVQVLEGFGSSFGPDVNAYTSFEETVYELELPSRSTDTLQLGLDVLHQWATAATIEDDAVVAERGVVREEHRRSTETLAGRLGVETRSVLLDGTPYLDRLPIGEIDVINEMTSEKVRAFYEQWYRPELMTIVAVGDFDPAAMEQRIIDTFTQPTSSEPASRDLEPLSAPLTEPVFDVFTDSEIQRNEVEVLWRLDSPAATTQSNLRRSLVSSLALSMVDTRLFERLQSGESTFLSASARASGYVANLQLVSLSARADAAELDATLRELLAELERARQFGFEQDELDRVVGSVRASIEQNYAERNTRQDSTFAAALVGRALGRESLPDAEASRDLSLEVLESITVDDVQRFLFEVLDSEPYVFVTSPQGDVQLVPAPEALAQAYDDVVGQTVAERERDSGDQTVLMARPEPAAVASEQFLAGLNAGLVTFENGVRLAYRQTEITENVVQMRAVSRGGFFAADADLAPLLDSAASMTSGSGFETVDAVTLDRILADSIVSLNTFVGRATEGLNGDAATDDLETLLQLTHLSMTEPIITDLRARQFDDGWRPVAEDPSIQPSIAGGLELWRLRYGDSPWFRYIPTVADLDGLNTDALLAAHRQRFASAGDFLFVVVGDFDPDELVDLGARYLGTLPDDGTREEPLDRDPGVPEDNLVATVEAGVGDQGSVQINWESPFPLTLEAEVTARALELVVNARLRDLIREELSASYAPNASITLLSEPKPWVDTLVEVESDPERIEEVSAAVRAELERIRAGDFDEQYLTLAVEQLTEGYRFFSNRDWIDLISFHLLNPERPEGEYRDRTALAQQITIADIAETAQIVFPASRSVEVRLLPAG